VSYWKFYCLPRIFKQCFTTFIHLTPYNLYLLHNNFYIFFTTQFLYNYYGIFVTPFNTYISYLFAVTWPLKVFKQRVLIMAYIKPKLVALKICTVSLYVTVQNKVQWYLYVPLESQLVNDFTCLWHETSNVNKYYSFFFNIWWGLCVLIVNMMCLLYTCIKLPDHGVCRSMLPSLTLRMLISLFCRMWTTRYMHIYIY
jgi:hypothetical protein